MRDQEQNDDYEWLVGRKLSLGVVMRVIEGADAMIRQDANTVLRMAISDLLHEDYKFQDRNRAQIEQHVPDNPIAFALSTRLALDALRHLRPLLSDYDRRALDVVTSYAEWKLRDDEGPYKWPNP